MTVSFRNVEVPPGASVEDWPYEAIATVIERGTLSDWLVLVRGIATDPWGPVARQVEDYLGYERPYGVAPLLERAIERSRQRAQQLERAAVADEVGELVALSGLTLADLATRVGTSRSRLSTYRSGTVIPSAAFMHRLRSTVERLRSSKPAVSARPTSARQVH